MNFFNQFDLIVSFACLHWVKDQLSFLNGAKNALKLGGKVIITLYPKHPEIWGAIDETTKKSNWIPYFTNYSNPHISYDLILYESLVKQARFNILQLEEKVPIAYFPQKKDAEAFLRSWLPHTDQIHPHLRDKFICDTIECFINRMNYDEQHPIGMPFRRLDITLEK